jgi:hypothetical protein
MRAFASLVYNRDNKSNKFRRRRRRRIKTKQTYSSPTLRTQRVV